MLKEFNDKAPNEFPQRLLGTFVVADAINSDLSEDAKLEWTNLRRDLNTVAQLFGQPVIPDTIVHVTQVTG